MSEVRWQFANVSEPRQPANVLYFTCQFNLAIAARFSGLLADWDSGPNPDSQPQCG